MKKKNIFKEFYIPLYSRYIFIACCNETDEIVNYLKRNKEIGKKVTDRLGRKGIEELKNMNGAVLNNTETKFPAILFMKNEKRDWYFWGTLIHEITHIVHTISYKGGFEDETEHKAYLTEYLFREIRRILQ